MNAILKLQRWPHVVFVVRATHLVILKSLVKVCCMYCVVLSVGHFTSMEDILCTKLS